MYTYITIVTYGDMVSSVSPKRKYCVAWWKESSDSFLGSGNKYTTNTRTIYSVHTFIWSDWWIRRRWHRSFKDHSFLRLKSTLEFQQCVTVKMIRANSVSLLLTELFDFQTTDVLNMNFNEKQLKCLFIAEEVLMVFRCGMCGDF